MTDTITSATQNADGSWDFGYQFDAGNNLFGCTTVHVPAPQDGGSYAPDVAKDASIPLAQTQKAAWVANVGNVQVTGPVTL